MTLGTLRRSGPLWAYAAAVITWSATPSLLGQAPNSDWYMSGANTARTSWVSTEVRGPLTPQWYVPVEPYIAPDVQVIATEGAVYLSTARGLYSFAATSGNLRWVYPTRFPLGNAPTVVDGVAYVGGFDRRVHAVDASNGRRIWISPQAGAGFQTNPLVIGGKVIAGNRDGGLYAYDAMTGTLLWMFQTGGPVLFSAAAYEGKVYVASNDSHVYALNENGTLAWKSAKLPGQGFNSWWPVVYRDRRGDSSLDRIIVSGSVNYRNEVVPGGPGGSTLHFDELKNVYPSRMPEHVGTAGFARGPWVRGTATLSAERILTYLAAHRHRRSVFVLDPHTGVEREPAPLLFAWTHSGARFPPVAGVDGALYQQMNHRGGQWIASGTVGAWVPGLAQIAPGGAGFAADEPVVSAAGGRVVYSSLCCDRMAHAYDVTDRSQQWTYYSYNLRNLLRGYNGGYYWNGRDYDLGAITVTFGASGNGVYGIHGDQNPPIPYGNRVYFHRGNSLIAYGTPRASPVARPVARTEAAPADELRPVGAAVIRSRLELELQRILDAGHLRPGYTSHGNFDHAGTIMCGDRLSEYWHTPSENLYPLLRAVSHVSPALRTALKAYIQREFTTYPPHAVDHIGWAGAAREIFDTPPDVVQQMNAANRSSPFNGTFKANGGWERRGVWGRNPLFFYVLWKYAEEFGSAAALYEASRGALEAPPDTIVLTKNPYAANAFIAGYHGFLELERLAGREETASARATLNALRNLRLAEFTGQSPYKDATLDGGAYCQQMSVASNFMYLVPELGEYMRANALSRVVDAIREYDTVAPYWMASLVNKGHGENAVASMYDLNAMFQAKALILREPAAELEKFLDVPGFARGDMFYLLNLVSVLDAYNRDARAPK